MTLERVRAASEEEGFEISLGKVMHKKRDGAIEISFCIGITEYRVLGRDAGWEMVELSLRHDWSGLQAWGRI